MNEGLSTMGGGTSQGANIVRFVLLAQNRTQPGIMGAVTGMKTLNMVGYSTGSQLTNTLNTVQGAAIAMGGAAAVGLGAAVIEAAKFEQQMNQVQAISGSTGAEMAFLGQQAKDMAMKYGADMGMVNEGLITLGRAGLKGSADQATVLEEGLKLAKLEGIELNESLEMLITTTGLLGTDVGTEGFTDKLKELNEQLINTSQLAPIKVKDIIQTLKYTGGTAEMANLGEGEGREDLFGVIALLGSRGVKGDVAGTALRAFLTRPASQTPVATNMLDAIGLKPGDLWTDNGNKAKPISEQIDIINKQMDDYELSQMQRIEFWSKMVGPKMANQIMKIDPDSVEPFTEKIAEGIDIEERINKIMDSAMEKWNQLKEAFKVGLISVGNNLLGVLKPVLDGLVMFFQLVGSNPIISTVVTIGLLAAGFLGLGVGINLAVSAFNYATAGLKTFQGGIMGLIRVLMGASTGMEGLGAEEAQLTTTTNTATTAINSQTAAHERATFAAQQQAIAMEQLGLANNSIFKNVATNSAIEGFMLGGASSSQALKKQNQIPKLLPGKYTGADDIIRDASYLHPNLYKGYAPKVDANELKQAISSGDKQFIADAENKLKSYQANKENAANRFAEAWSTSKFNPERSKVHGYSASEYGPQLPNMQQKLSNIWKNNFLDKSFLKNNATLAKGAASGNRAISALSTGITGLISPAGLATVALIAIVAALALLAWAHDAWKKSIEAAEKKLEESSEKYDKYEQRLWESANALEKAKNAQGDNTNEIERHEEAVKKHSESMRAAALDAQMAARQLAKEESHPIFGNWNSSLGNWLFGQLGMNEQKYSSPSEGTWMAEKTRGMWNEQNSLLSGADTIDAMITQKLGGDLAANKRIALQKNLVGNWTSKNAEGISMLNSFWGEFSTLYNQQTDMINQVWADMAASTPNLTTNQVKEMINNDIQIDKISGKAKLSTDRFGKAGEDYVKMLNRMSDKTGLTVQEIMDILDYMQVEQVVADASNKMENLFETQKTELDAIKAVGESGNTAALVGLMGDSNAQQEAMIEILATQYALEIWSMAWWMTFMNNAWLTLYTLIGMGIQAILSPLIWAAQFLLNLVNNVAGFADMVANGFNAITSALGGFFSNLGGILSGTGIPGLTDAGNVLKSVGATVSGAKIDKADVKNIANGLLGPIANFDAVSWLKNSWGEGAIRSNAALDSLGLSEKDDKAFQKLVGKYMALMDPQYRGTAGTGEGDGKDTKGSGTDSVSPDKGGKDKKSDLDALKKITVEHIFCKNKRLPDINVNLHDRTPLVDVNQSKLNIGKLEVVSKKDAPEDYMTAITNELINKADIIAPTTISAKNKTGVTAG